MKNIEGKFEERNKEKAEKALIRNESRNAKGNIPGKQEAESNSVISRQNLIEDQSNDKELLDLFKIALTPVEAEVSVGYLIKDNILMIKWSSHHVTIAPLLLLKEKWLDEDPEKISVLKYVTTFKDRLFRAGHMAKRNLQAKYSGPYKVVKKISDTNYLVRTPGSIRKHICVISICSKHTMKNQKPELVTLNNKNPTHRLENPTHSESCVGLEAEKEEDNDSEVRLGNDQQPIELQNSQILNNLGTKLSHLPSLS